jgi:ATP-binding cassette subfamily B protein
MIRGEDQRGRKLRWMAGLLRPYRGRVALTLLSILLATGAALAPPYLAGQAIDAAILTEDTGALTLIVLAFVAVAVIYAAATYAQTYLVGWVGTRALQDLRERIFAHIQSMSIGFFTRRSPGVLISRMTNDVEALNQLVTSGVVTLLSSGLTLIGVVAIMLFLDLKLALVTFITFPLLAIASVVFRIVSHGAYRLTRERIAAVTAYLQETLSGVRVVRSFGQEPRHAAAMDELNEANREANMKTVYLNATYFPAVELLSAVGTAAIVLYGGTQVIDNALQVGVVVAFVGYLQLFFDPIQQLSQLYTTYQQGMAALDKIFDLLDTEPDMVDAPGAIDPGTLRGEIELEGVCFAYADQDWALRDVDLHVPPGQTLALVGATGAGKSTLAKLVARFYDPQKGRVLVDGHNLRGVRQQALRRQLGIVPQEGFLFSGSVRENIAFGRPEATLEEIEAAAAAVGATGFVEALPAGFETEVGERGVQLSAGQRQLVAFARALLAEPRILILDEATSNVDVRTEKTIEAGLERLLAGRTAIVIAHRLSTIRRAGKIVVLDGGRVAESGSHDELIEAGGAYARLYGAWAESSAA